MVHISKSLIVKIVIGIAILAIVTNIIIDIPVKHVKDRQEPLFPGYIGDTLLRKNETGSSVIRGIILTDNFKGDIVQGYRATYNSSNGTMAILVAQMKDNGTAYRSFKDMIVRIGYNENESFDKNDTNWTIIKLRVDNPEVFVIRKDNRSMWHYTFSKLDKVYWIGFNNDYVDYQLDMIVEVFRNVDKTKGAFD